MEVVEVWLLLGAQVYQDFLTDNPDLLQGFRLIFDQFTSAQRHDLHEFLVRVMSSEPTPRELAQLWSESGANLLVDVDDMPKFFDVLLRELESSISANG